jgi:hypothetical protein
LRGLDLNQQPLGYEGWSLDHAAQPPTGNTYQPRARVHLQVDPAADRVPLRRERVRLADDVEITPALGQAALALERRAATVPVRQIHRLASAVGGMDRGQPAPGPLLQGGVLAGRDSVPELDDRCA